MRLRVGVTGHRILADTDRIAAAVDDAFEAFDLRFPGRTLTLLSALAEGADRLVVGRALRRPGATLHALLPAPRAVYTSSFRSAASSEEFDQLLALAERVVELPGGATPEASYAAAAARIVADSDLLLAVWDGAPARGAGGTGAVVALARRRGLPLAWVRAGNRRADTDAPTTLGAEQGRLVLERLGPNP